MKKVLYDKNGIFISIHRGRPHAVRKLQLFPDKANSGKETL